MLTLVVKELTGFKGDLRRDLIADSLSRPVLPSDSKFMMAVVDYGNAYMERAQNDPANKDAVIWFDIHWGEPAVVGMTWAYNPFNKTDPEVGTLRSCQEQFAAYCVQR